MKSMESSSSVDDNAHSVPSLVSDFHSKYKHSDEADPKSFREKISQTAHKLCEKPWWLKVVKQNFPFLTILRRYKIKEDLPSDFVSGLTVGIMQIPQSMAYAMLASLPPICGLYTALFAPIVYFFVGSSKHISMGVIAIVGLMIGTVLEREVGEDDAGPMMGNSSYNSTDVAENGLSDIASRRIQVATALSFVSGLFMVLIGKLGFGVVTSYMSEPLVGGFTTGAAVHVITSQIKHVFGLKVKRYNGAFKVIYTWVALFGSIAKTNFAALIMSVICMVVLYLVKVQVNQRFRSKLRVPIPIELFVVILGTLASHFGNFHDNYDLKVVQDIPAGLPKPQLPDLRLARSCISDAIIIGVVAFAQSVSMAKIFAKKKGYKIDSNQEMVGYGAGSVFASIFSGYITAASVARSSVQESAGGRTQVASLFSCGIVFGVVMAVGPLFYNLPTCVLAAVIIVSLRSLFLQVFDLKPLWRTSKYDFAIWLVTFVGVVILDADYGLGIGIIFSLLTVVVRTQRTKGRTLGRFKFSDIYLPEREYNQVQTVNGVVIFSYDSSVYFANSDNFVNLVHKATGIDPDKVKRQMKRQPEEMLEIKTGSVAMEQNSQTSITEKCALTPLTSEPDGHIHHVLIDCSGVNFVDTMGVKAFKQVILDYEEINITVFLAHCQDEVIKVIKSTDFWEKYQDRVYFDITGAVRAASA